MDNPTPPKNATELFRYVDQETAGLELEPEEVRAILEFDSKELAPLRSPVTSYFILGSYRSPYIYRLRSTAHELRKYGAYTIILGDVNQLETDRLPDEDIMFALIGAYCSYIVGIYEKDSGGEGPELGEIDDPPFFERAYVYARDYDPNPNPDLELVIDTLRDYFNDQMEEIDCEHRLKKRLRVSDSGLSKEDVEDIVSRRLDEDEPETSYSWPHVNKFRKFNLYERFYAWTDPKAVPDLIVETIPGPEQKSRD